MVNYEADIDLIKPYLPAGTDPDLFKGHWVFSMVGFRFTHIIKGWVVPFHQRFEEVNLHFYVRWKINGQWRGGTVFIAEFVPKPMITLVARSIYSEQYFTKKMNHTLELEIDSMEATYRWKTRKWYFLSIRVSEPALRC
jgi:uncharacterized protein YqjF (DUF2071 family)